MTLEEFWANDYQEEGIYALWQIEDLPDVGEFSNVKGINHCTGTFTNSEGFDFGGNHEWIERSIDSNVKIMLLESMEQEDYF